MGRDIYNDFEYDLDRALMVACKSTPARGLELIRDIESKYQNIIASDDIFLDHVLKCEYTIFMMLPDYERALGCITLRLSHYRPDFISNYDLCISILALIDCVTHLYSEDKDRLAEIRKLVHKKVFYDAIGREASIALVVRSLIELEKAEDAAVFKSVYARACAFYGLNKKTALKPNLSKMIRIYNRTAATPPLV